MTAVPDLTRGPVLLSLSVVTTCLALSTCALRFFVRTRVSHDVGVDDFAMALAAFVALVGAIVSALEGTAQTSADALRFDVMGQTVIMTATALAKISICLLFLRLVGAVRAWRVVFLSQAVLMALANVAFAVVTNLQCRPLAALWLPRLPGGVCWDPEVQLRASYARGALSVFWWLFLSLVPVVAARDLDQALKWPFYCLSGLGVVAGVFATVRTYEASQIQAQSGVYTYNHFVAALMSVLEQSLGIVAGNVLVFGPLLSRDVQAGQLDSRATSRSSNDPFKPRGGDASSLRSLESGREPLVKEPAVVRESRRRPESIELSRSGSMRSITGSGSSGGGGGVSGSGGGGGGGIIARSLSRRARTRTSIVAGESAWPEGIIVKTVEVAVTVETDRDADRVGTLARSESTLQDYDWDRMLPPAPPR